ncbi:MAG: nuclear transport factor 2 family protein [Bacteroidota bacterium]|nr:nuclear transport factor 2 family protein [Bacteroidota bacterium]
MKPNVKPFIKLGLFFLLAFSFFNQAALAQVFITHVNVVDPIHQKILTDQTVKIQGTLIDSLGPAGTLVVPEGAQVVEGKDKFLIPSMTDGAVQLFSDGGFSSRPDQLAVSTQVPVQSEIEKNKLGLKDVLRRYLDVGITSVFDLGTPGSFFTGNDSVQSGPASPDILGAGPLLCYQVPTAFKNLRKYGPFVEVHSPAQAIREVSEVASHHRGFVTLDMACSIDSEAREDSEQLAVLKAVITEGHEKGLKVAVLTTRETNAQSAVEYGCDYLIGDIADQVITDSLLNEIKQKKVVVCPVLRAADNYFESIYRKRKFTTFELETANPEFLGSFSEWRASTPGRLPSGSLLTHNGKSAVQELSREDSLKRVNLKRMASAGVTVIAGSGAGNLGTEHAASYLNELQAMKTSGLSNWQVIRAATTRPEGLFSRAGLYGTISKGNPADLLLLNANPSANLKNLEKIACVFKNGRLILPDTLIAEDPAELVQKQVNGYNYGNIDVFMDPYADNVGLYQFPDLLLSTGKAAIMNRMESMFKKYPHLHCQITQRLVQGNYVIDKETISGMNHGETAGTVVYEIAHKKIAKVFLMM